MPLSFEVNRGQASKDVRFLSRGAGYGLSLKSNEAVLNVRNGKKSASVGMKLLGANPSPKIEGIEEQPGKSNYLIGGDPAKWQTDVANYAKVAAFGPGLANLTREAGVTPLPTALSSVNATIGGTAAEVLYAGPQPTFAGLDQINVRLPRTLAGRGEVDVVVTAEGKAANVVRIDVK